MLSETSPVHFYMVIPTVVMAPCSTEATGCSCEFVSCASLGSLGWACYGQWVISLLNVSGSFVPMHSRDYSSSYQLPVGGRRIYTGPLGNWGCSAAQESWKSTVPRASGLHLSFLYSSCCPDMSSLSLPPSHFINSLVYLFLCGKSERGWHKKDEVCRGQRTACGAGSLSPL